MVRCRGRQRHAWPQSECKREASGPWRGRRQTCGHTSSTPGRRSTAPSVWPWVHWWWAVSTSTLRSAPPDAPACALLSSPGASSAPGQARVLVPGEGGSQGNVARAVALYASFVTLATLGYGNRVPSERGGTWPSHHGGRGGQLSLAVMNAGAGLVSTLPCRASGVQMLAMD